MPQILEKLQQMNLELPKSAKPIGSYVPALKIGNFIYTSGNLPLQEGQLACTGKVNKTSVTIETAAQAAQLCTLNALAAVQDLIGDLDKITQVVKVTGFVQSDTDFHEQPKVINGASDFLKALFGDQIGSHARSAVGVNELPLNASVEIEYIFYVE